MKKELSDYYIYLHKRLDNGVVFYVGQGRLNRAKTSHKRNPNWKQEVENAGGFVVEYISTELTKVEATEKEYNLLLNPDKNWNLVNSRLSLPITPVTDLSYFKDFVAYDENSPSGLVWLVGDRGRKVAGTPAGSFDVTSSKGYWRVQINKQSYAAHRVVWVLHHGIIDNTLVINHIDHNRANNRIENLELVSQAINSRRSVKQENELVGINYHTVKSHGDQKIYKYWVAYWHDTNSVRSSKSFSIDKYGNDQAKLLAIEYRKSKLIQLNEQYGAGYIL